VHNKILLFTNIF